MAIHSPTVLLVPDPFVSTCGLCHDTPNLGNHSLSVPMNVGVADPPGGRFNRLDTSYLPVITICKKPALDAMRGDHGSGARPGHRQVCGCG